MIELTRFHFASAIFVYTLHSTALSSASLNYVFRRQNNITRPDRMQSVDWPVKELRISPPLRKTYSDVGPPLARSVLSIVLNVQGSTGSICCGRQGKQQVTKQAIVSPWKKRFLRQRVWAPGVPFTTRSLSAVNSFRNSLHRMVFTGHPFLLEVRHDTLAAKGAHPLPVYYWRTEVRINRKEPLKLGSAGTPPPGGE